MISFTYDQVPFYISCSSSYVCCFVLIALYCFQTLRRRALFRYTLPPQASISIQGNIEDISRTLFQNKEWRYERVLANLDLWFRSDSLVCKMVKEHERQAATALCSLLLGKQVARYPRAIYGSSTLIR